MSIISSSPDVCRGEELHIRLFGFRRVAKLVRIVANRTNIFDFIIRPIIRARLKGMLRVDGGKKPSARYSAVKIMDYYAGMSRFFLDAPEPFDSRCILICFLRNPFGVCESLIRSGHTLEQAIKWCEFFYSEVDAILRAGSNVKVLRFEDFQAQPVAFTRELFSSLSLSAPIDETISLKVKRFGRERLNDEDASQPELVPVGIDAISSYVDAAVEKKSFARLSLGDRDTIQSRMAAQVQKYYSDCPWLG